MTCGLVDLWSCGLLSIVLCPSPKNTESSQYTANFRQKHKKFAVYCKLFSHLSIAETIATKLLQQEIGSTNHFNTTVVDHQSHLIHRNNIFGIIIFYFLQIAKLPFVSIVVGNIKSYLIIDYFIATRATKSISLPSS